ncbi:MAG: DUF1307 domain-containing protein [Peptoniphilaceae bacterium]|uniref:YehR family lipoprotein n=1 Tax=Parvimonas sp. TaxID=1944660 RepID=UPI0025D746BA|nr:DUF1307 domain-containing protein [Parvimonas sp.]MCI5996864.1 DUF1307 domain-containing protein [Parvimonas sp.]MDD7764660.1 DUF1307 domain-containing protein [Peptoniphilaceae bacterium]MDY3050509.1 DUF1307 domain-containing protein [Parvimonas sp.]
MKKLKNILKSVAILCMLVFVVGCGSKAEKLKTKTFVLEKTGVKIELTYYYNGDMVSKQSANNSISYDLLKQSLAVKTKEEVIERLKKTSETYKGIDGIEYSGEYKETEFIEKLTVDYTKLDYQKAKGIPGIILTGDPKSGISLSKSEELLKNQGFTEKK